MFVTTKEVRSNGFNGPMVIPTLGLCSGRFVWSLVSSQWMQTIHFSWIVTCNIIQWYGIFYHVVKIKINKIQIPKKLIKH